MLTLYYAPGACSMAAHIVLEESGEKYQPQKVDLADGEQRTEAYLKINPLGRVPALRLDDGDPLTENTAILPYLGKRFALWPTDPLAEAKALANRLLRRERASRARPCRPARALHRRPVRVSHDQGGRPQDLPRLPEADRRPAGGAGMVRRQYSVLDPYGFVFYTWGVRRELPMAELKNYTAFKDRMVQRPAVQRVVEDEKIKL